MHMSLCTSQTLIGYGTLTVVLLVTSITALCSYSTSVLADLHLVSQALFYKKYSTSSDVWSYGMLMYEIWTLGKKPFPQLSPTEVNCIILLQIIRCCVLTTSVCAKIWTLLFV